MGAGFIITIILLACLLGVFSRQALAMSDEQAAPDSDEKEEHPQSHAM